MVTSENPAPSQLNNRAVWSSMTEGLSDALLIETFGPGLLAYLCNVNEARLTERFRDASLLPEPGEEALRQLVPLAERIAGERLEQPGIPGVILTQDPWLRS